MICAKKKSTYNGEKLKHTLIRAMKPYAPKVHVESGFFCFFFFKSCLFFHKIPPLHSPGKIFYKLMLRNTCVPSPAP